MELTLLKLLLSELTQRLEYLENKPESSSFKDGMCCELQLCIGRLNKIILEKLDPITISGTGNTIKNKLIL